MKIICDCGATTEINRTHDSDFTDGEGCYSNCEGDIRFWSAHDIVGFVCDKCGEQLWSFV